MRPTILRFCLLLCAAPIWAAAADPIQLASRSSESEYLADLPVVLSVSRLAQPLDETPGAVTVIDQDMIRMSGARNVAELMRLVPGFQVSDSVEAFAPPVSYHGSLNSFPNEMQVLIDGRSVYGAYTIGSVAPGLQTIDLGDIERIEVLRGSDSAAYGARAFLGVINIITHDPLATHGVAATARRGGDGIADQYVRMGWGSDRSDTRVSLGRRQDSGLAGAAGGSTFSNFNARSDLRPNPADEIELRGGFSDQTARVGDPTKPGDLPRDNRSTLGYLQADWRRVLAVDDDMLLSYAHSEERYRNAFAYPGSTLPGGLVLFAGTSIDSGGSASNDNLMAQRTTRYGDSVRVVWGGELRREAVKSAPLYGTDNSLSIVFRRLYGNVEWRPAPALLLNGGGMYEEDSTSSSTFAPRAMLNWHVLPKQTLRIGASRSYRPPSIYENSVDQQFVGAPVAFGGTSFVPAYTVNLSRGNLRPEALTTKELGYLGEFGWLGTTIDVRWFNERVKDFIGRTSTSGVGSPAMLAPYYPPTGTYVNGATPEFPIHGYEYQLQFRPWTGGRILVNHASITIDAQDAAYLTSAPQRSDAIVWLQELPQGIDFSLMHFEASSAPWVNGSSSAWPAAWRRNDVRLAKRFTLGGSRLEAAVVWQNIGPAYYDYPSSIDSANGVVTVKTPQQFERRAFFSIGLEL
jgi:iron complex outermembrane receptor protein